MDRIDVKRAQIAHLLEGVEFEHRCKPLTVADVMTATPTTVESNMTVLELVRSLQRYGFRHLLVVNDDGTLAGVLSDRDVIRCFGPDRYPDERRLSSITADQIMSTDVITVSPETRVELAVQMMIAHGISCLPVVAHEKVVGIVTNTDLHVLLQVLLSGLCRTLESQARHAVRA
jgi:acetoin utilization protein AcuB